MNSFWVLQGSGGDAATAHGTREDAVGEIRTLFQAGLAERGEFYVVERDREGRVVRVFDVDDEIASGAEWSR